MSGEMVYQQQKKNTSIPPALTQSAPEPVSEPESPEPDQPSKQHPAVRKEPEKLLQEENGSHAKKEALNSPPESGSEDEEEEEPDPEPELPIEKEKEHPHPAENINRRSHRVEQQDKDPAPLPPALRKETVKSDHPPAKEAEAHLRSQPPPPVQEHQQQKKQAAQRPPK